MDPDCHEKNQLLFRDVMRGAKLVKVDNLACISLGNIPESLKTGVLRFMWLSSSLSVSSLGPASFRIAYGTDNGTALPLKWSHVQHAVKCLCSAMRFLPEAQQKFESKDIRYSIVDGNYRHSTITLVTESAETWKALKWYVTVISFVFLSKVSAAS